VTAADDSREMVLRADRIYAAGAAPAETRSTAPRLDMANISHFPRDQEHALSMEEQGACS
jgi:hypothetical protein